MADFLNFLRFYVRCGVIQRVMKAEKNCLSCGGWEAEFLFYIYLVLHDTQGVVNKGAIKYVIKEAN